MAQLPLQRVRGLPSPEVRISYATPTVLASPVTAPIFVKTPDTVSGRSTPMAMAFQPTQALAPAVQKVSTPRCAEAPKVKAPEVEVPQPDLPGPPAEVSPRERSKTPKTPRTPRSLQNSLSQPAVGGHLPGRIQGISCCALCHSLLQIFAGKVRIQTFANSSELPAPPARLVDRALAYELSEADDVAASDTFCRLHHLHKNRYELWLKGQDAIRRCTARGDAQATRVIRSCAEEMGKLDNICGKVEQEYLEAFASFFKQLQQDVRENLFKTLMGKADELVNAWQHEIEEVNQQIDKKVQQKRHNLQTAVHRRHEAAKEDFWRQHEKQCAQQFVSCLVDMHIGRAMDASTAFKELELSQQARRPATEKSVEGKAQSRADQERAKREREMKIWLSKMDQLQTLQHLQACKDRELVYLRVAMTIRRLEEDQGVEHRLVVSRVSQHLQQMRMFLEKTLRASGVSSCVDLMGVTPGSIVLERESFIHMVLRNERILGDVSACGGGGASPRSARSAQSACQGISASFASGSRGGKGADQLGASLELRAFGEFLGARFPSLRAAMSAMDLTGTGRVACFELESWLRQHMYPGNARMLLKDLGRKGSLGMSQLRFLAPSFVRAGQCGRPSGATAASLLRRLWGQSDLRARRYQPLEAQQAAIRCCRCICSFLNAAISVSLVDEPQDLHETASVAGTGRLGDQGLGTFQSVLSSRSRGEREPSLAEIGGRSKLEAVKGDVDKRRSMMHYRPSSARVPSEKLTPRNLRGKSHQQRRDAELKRLSPMSLPKCIQTIRGRSLKQRLQSPPRSRSNSPTRSRTGSPVRRLLEIGEPVEDRLAPPPYVPPTASPSTTVAEAKEVEEQDSEAIGPVVRRRSQHLSHTVSAGSLQPSGSAQQLLLSRPCASRPLIRSPSAPPVVYTTLRSVAGAPSTPLTLAAPPVTVAAPIVRQVSLGRKELSPRVRWESDGPTPKAPVPSTGSLRRSTTLQMPATVRVSSTPCLTKAQSLPTTPLLPVTLNSISPSGSASNSPRFFVSGSTPMNYRPPVTTVGPVMPLSGVTGTPVASVAATWAVFGEKTRGASAGPGRVRNGSPEVFGI